MKANGGSSRCSEKGDWMIGVGEKKTKTNTDAPTSLGMIMQMVEKLWPVSPTSCACTLGKKHSLKPSEASHSSSFTIHVEPPPPSHIKLWCVY